MNTLRGMTILVNSWVTAAAPPSVKMELPRLPVLVRAVSAGVRVRWGERIVSVPLNTVLPKALFPTLLTFAGITKFDNDGPAAEANASSNAREPMVSKLWGNGGIALICAALNAVVPIDSTAAGMASSPVTPRWS